MLLFWTIAQQVLKSYVTWCCDALLTIINPIQHRAPKMFLTTVLECLRGESRNFVTFNINL